MSRPATTTVEIPEWLTIGADVATISNSRGGHTLNLAKVLRIGKRDVVLDDGQRFPARTLTRHEGGTWGWSVRLFAASDPIVAKTAAELRRARLVSSARLACDEFQRGRLTAFDVILALAPLTGVAAEIAALATTPESSPSLIGAP